MLRRSSLCAWLLSLCACPAAPATDGPAAWDGGACNGSASLCDRRYDSVSYGTAHNAMSSVQRHWQLPNQRFAVPRQLQDGVRALMLDVHPGKDGGTFLCHELCELGSQPLTEGLAEVEQFLREHPGEVVTLIFESYVSAAEVEGAFAEADLTRYALAHDAGAPWPTLREMISSGKRLVVLTDRDPQPPWYLDVWAEAWETPFANAVPSDFTCAPNRGRKGNRLFILNHFLANPTASEALAREVNFNPFLHDRAFGCRADAGQPPNFVTVDFYSEGDLQTVVGELNAAR